jgi:hypothetical protein
MRDVLGKVNGIDVQRYDVVQVSDDGVTWLDYVTIKNASELPQAQRLVNGEWFGGHREDLYRITRSGGAVVVPCSLLKPSLNQEDIRLLILAINYAIGVGIHDINSELEADPEVTPEAYLAIAEKLKKIQETL